MIFQIITFYYAKQKQYSMLLLHNNEYFVLALVHHPVHAAVDRIDWNPVPERTGYRTGWNESGHDGRT
ncbi:hypothetical protein [Virgibacillus pantothenticus]|uniref:hypothetical protein n=2 Tax=Virgibacillus pantothenticus TaxID=1473 RepID=UPI001C221A81|nr:hypothetical protein [Virgibacillus pantothenticus]MBU8643450.1 hypothetical protein [Virgibacillus pantothenticus]MBU8661410.1 hypothetical protein [Virgibacillus pantothenticus]MBU8673985.1 hypothetical protein [Virgibacillus pantothenticus]MBU8705468.1 hypothetical protein [Virgibacillus pantothenticus]MBU8797217.1 hypothetical protein [Virgibacillus pantothenticus]